MSLSFKYDVDPQYKFKVVKEMTERTPSYLTRLTQMATPEGAIAFNYSCGGVGCGLGSDQANCLISCGNVL